MVYQKKDQQVVQKAGHDRKQHRCAEKTKGSQHDAAQNRENKGRNRIKENTVTPADQKEFFPF